MRKKTLICIPHAGGTAQFFNRWLNVFPQEWKFKPLELGGRGRRQSEPPPVSIEQCVDDYFEQIKSTIESMDYILWGNSMGAVISYELAQKVKYELGKEPLCFLATSMRAPHVQKDKTKIFYNLSDDNLLKQLIKMLEPSSYTPEIVLLMEEFLDVIRNDFRIVETFRSDLPSQPLQCPIHVIIGEKDSINLPGAEMWKYYTNGKFTLDIVADGHFFMLNNLKVITKTLIQEIAHLEES